MPSRKSKQAGGNYPLTHYERTKKFASSEYGTTSKRLAGISQYQLGDCGLSLSRLEDKALCTESGYLYEPSVMLEYLLQKTMEIKEQKALYEAQQDQNKQQTADNQQVEKEKKRTAFIESQQVVKRQKQTVDQKQVAYDQLKGASYWLSDAQPQIDQGKDIKQPKERPESPHSQEPLIRKDLWEVQLNWQDGKLVCDVSGKALRNSVVAYWTSRQEPGRIVLQDSLKMLNGRCHQTGKKIKYTRTLQSSGTSFSSSSQTVEAKLYRPTIT
jgi:nitric oxide synthase-interacting protein